MKIDFIIDERKHLTPRTPDDKKRMDNLREKAKVGDLFTFELFADRSTAQHRMYWAVLGYTIYGSEAVAKEHGKPEGLHLSLKWQYCMMRPELFVTTKVYIDSKVCEAKVPFSESPRNGIDSSQMREYMDWAINTCAQMLGITVQEIISASKKLKNAVHEH